ncbi:MAG: TonB-dependent receptor [Acidobacteria bacterium]|nr:TonB-dependent receptor [Acidobacteriota bacterium]
MPRTIGRVLLQGLLFFLLTFLALGRAQGQLQGHVTDATGAAVARAKVTFRSGSVRAVQFTDGAGKFAFREEAVTSGTIEVSADGFQSQSYKWQAGSSAMSIVLAPATVTEDVTVTANRVSTRVVETPTSVVVLSHHDLAATAALTTDDMLRQVTGFSLFRRSGSRTANPTSQGVSLRGLGASGPSRALVLADGFPLNDPFGGWVYWNRVPHVEIRSIEVANGGASHLYGSDALGGVVNLLRRPSAEDGFSLDGSYGNENSGNLSFAGGKQIGNWAGSVAGEWYSSDGYIAVPSDQRGSVDKPVNAEYATGEAGLVRSFGEKGNLFVRGSIYGEARNNGTPIQVNSATVRELTFGGNWNAGGWGALNLRGYASREGLYQTFSSIAADRNSETLSRRQWVPAQRVGFSAQWVKSLGTRQNLVAGVEQWNVHGMTNELGAVSVLHAGGREVNWAAYGEDMIRLTPNWLLTLSGRIDHWQNFSAFSATVPFTGPEALTPYPDRSETFFSPRAALLRKVNSNLSLTASAYRSFRAPTLNELYRGFRLGNVVTNANADLQAERLTGGEAGAIVSGWAQRFLLRATYFYAHISDPITNVTLSTTPTLITRQRQNLGSTRSQGLEVEATGQLKSWLLVSSGYQYTGAVVLESSTGSGLVGKDIPQVPREQWNFQVRYSKPFLVAGIQGRYVGAQFDDDINSLVLRRYFTMDLLLSHPLRPGLEVFGAAENLLNQRYDVARTPTLTVGPPILARVGLRLQWGAR